MFDILILVIFWLGVAVLVAGALGAVVGVSIAAVETSERWTLRRINRQRERRQQRRRHAAQG